MLASTLGALGTIVMVQRCGTLDLHSSTDRTWPVTVDSADLAVAALPLNWAIRKRRTSFWSVVSNVNMKLSLAHVTIAFYCYPSMKIRSSRSTAGARVSYAADPGNTASILVFSVAALNGLAL